MLLVKTAEEAAAPGRLYLENEKLIISAHEEFRISWLSLHGDGSYVAAGMKIHGT